MPLGPNVTYRAFRVSPVIDPSDASEIPVNLIPSTSFPAGCVLGERIGIDETVTVTLSATGGSFTETFNAVTSAAINYTDTAAQIQAKLEAMASIGAGNILVTRVGDVITEVFRNALGQTNVGAITTTATGLTGGAGTAVVAVVAQGAAGTAGLYGPYLAGATDGTQVAKGILAYPCVTDASGNISFGTGTGGEEWGQTHKAADMWIRGTFRTEDCVGLDQAAIDALGRLIYGTRTHGAFTMFGP